MLIEIQERDINALIEAAMHSGTAKQRLAQKYVALADHEAARRLFEDAQAMFDAADRLQRGRLSERRWEAQVRVLVDAIGEVLRDNGRVAQAGPTSEWTRWGEVCGAVAELKELL